MVKAAKAMKAKAQPKAALKKTINEKEAKKTVQHKAFGAPKEEQETPSQKLERKLARRDTDDQYERAVEEKLAHVDPLVIKTRRNKEGKSIEQAIKDEIYRLRKKKAPGSSRGPYISMDF